MNLSSKRPTFHESGPRSNPYRVFALLLITAAGVWLIQQKQHGKVQPLFMPTPTATRTANSWAEEGAALFNAGHLQGSIDAYQKALVLDPNNAQLWAELARIQTYSSSLLTTKEERLARLQDALASIDQAVALAPDESTIHAIRALVLDWNASQIPEQRDVLLNEAEAEARRALQLESWNPLALAFYAEVLSDQQKWAQAEGYARQAVDLAPDSMDTHRVYAVVLESLGKYRQAIEEYEKAVKINPNLTFLYLSIGYNYRHLEVYDRALTSFDKAASINQQLGIKDPLPYIAIAKTYAQQGEFFIAARNAERAVLIDPTNANTYAQLGRIYIQGRNYEGAIPVLKCAVEGCTAAENQQILQQLLQSFYIEENIGGVDIQPLPLNSLDVAFYYVQYGSILAALDRCEEALPFLELAGATFPHENILEIVQESKMVCATLKGSPQMEISP
ncbi:MAG: tetratricopeptide repeat protein [Chloroflexota bacterium]